MLRSVPTRSDHRGVMQEPNGYGALLLPAEHVDDDDEDDDDDNGDVGSVSSWNGSTIFAQAQRSSSIAAAG